MHDKKLGRNPFEKNKVTPIVNDVPETLLFKDVVKPSSDLEKLKEMQIQVDWNELYKNVAKSLTRFFAVLSFFYLTGCALGQQQSDLKKQMVELQKTVSKQANTIDELNNKIYLLSDRVDHFEKPKTNPVLPAAPATKPVAAVPAKPGDLQIYDMALKDLKNNATDSFAKKVELLVKGFKNSPLTNNALYLLGQHHYNNKKYFEASKVFERLYSLSPDGNRAVSALYMLGLNYQKQNRIQESKEAYQTVINIYPGSQEAVDAQKNLMALNQGSKK